MPSKGIEKEREKEREKEEEEKEYSQPHVSVTPFHRFSPLY